MRNRFLTALGALTVTLGALGFSQTAASQSIFAPQTEAGKFVPANQAQMQMSFSPLVKQTAPAVVNVYSSRTVKTRSNPFMSDPFFSQFFGGSTQPRERMERSLGSGVIVRSNGVIVTNSHVVDGADELRIVLNDRREFDAKIIAQDEASDLAVLQIDTKGERLPVLPIAQDSGLEVGDLVLAIGNPFGVGQTVTSGIVSALGRTNVTDLSSFIQTDAAVNPGNSGGALVGMDGSLIGVNTAIFSRSGGSNGIGFAIPAELVGRAVESAVKDGEIVRPWIGARTQAVSSDMALALGLDRPRGAIISDIYEGGPSDRAGLSKGDVILSVDGTAINDDSGLRFKLATLAPGQRAKLNVFTDSGREKTVTVTAALMEESPAPDAREIEGDNPFSGIVVVNMSPKLAETMDFDPYIQGVVVSKIRSRSAARRRFRPGDILLEINGRKINAAKDVARAIETGNASREWDISLDRGGRIQTGTIRY